MLRMEHSQQLVFLNDRSVVGVMAVAVPIRTVWPAMQPSPKKSLGPNIATTASFPDPFTTENFTPPFWTYMTLLAAVSPWRINRFVSPKFGNFSSPLPQYRGRPAGRTHRPSHSSCGLFGFIFRPEHGHPYTRLPLARSTVTRASLTKLCRREQSKQAVSPRHAMFNPEQTVKLRRGICMCRLDRLCR